MSQPAVTLAHLALAVAAGAWVVVERRRRPTRVAATRMALATAVLVALADAVLLLSTEAPLAARALAVAAFVAGLSLLVLSLLQGFPNRGAVAVSAVAAATPFLLSA